MSDVRVDFEEWLRREHVAEMAAIFGVPLALLSRRCMRCRARVHPMVDLGGDDHLVLVETPLTVTASGSFRESNTVTLTAQKYMGLRRCSEIEWSETYDDEGRN